MADHHEGAVVALSQSSSQSIAARSRWLVGSSSSSRSGSCASARAIAARRRSPPLTRFRAGRPGRCRAGRRSLRPRARRRVVPAERPVHQRRVAGEDRGPARASRSACPAGPCACPRSASIWSAISRSSVVLPAPLRPISASRSRGPTRGRDRGTASGRPGAGRDSSQLRIGAAGHGARALAVRAVAAGPPSAVEHRDGARVVSADTRSPAFDEGDNHEYNHSFWPRRHCSQLPPPPPRSRSRFRARWSS